MGRSGDETNVSMRFTSARVVSVDDEQTGIFALRTGVGLQRDSGEAGDLGEPIFELLKKCLVAASLLQWRERMEFAELGPAYGKHFDAGVELHRAGTERDHRGREGEIAGFEPLDVAEHLGFGMVAIEDRMGEIFGGAQEILWQDA